MPSEILNGGKFIFLRFEFFSSTQRRKGIFLEFQQKQEELVAFPDARIFLLCLNSGA